MSDNPFKNQAFLPADALELIEQLDRKYPERCIGLSQTIEEAHFYAGKRALINELIMLKQKTEQKQMRDEINPTRRR
jgi:hypothetical protein